MEIECKGGSLKELPMEIQKILKSIDFPVHRNDVIEKEKKYGAVSDILRGLGMLPDKEYTSAEEVAMELHKIYMGVPS